MHIRTILTFMILLLAFPVGVYSATYTWYFSDDATGNAAGNDSAAGTIGDPWKSLYKAQTQIETLTGSDTATLYFDRGDTWDASTPNICDSSLCSAWTSGNRDNVLRLHTGTVHVTAYGSGALPIFDGGISDFSSDPRTANRGNEPAISIESDDSTFKNIELKGVQSIGIRPRGTDLNGVEISGCKIHNVGYSCIQNLPANNYDYYDILIENNECYDAVQLKRYGHTSGWPGGISMDGASSTGGNYHSNIIRGNKVYNIYGEGILISVGHGGGGTEETIVEENFIGDTWHPALLVHYNGYEAGRGIIRYNKIVSSTTGRAIYGDSACEGIAVYDEQGDGYDNATYGDFEIYGNIIIGRYIGMRLYCDQKGYNEPLGSLKIFNNTIIGSWHSNIYMQDTAGADDVLNLEIYNNALMYFDQANQAHIRELRTVDYGNATITDNYYWEQAGTDSGIVDGDWDTNLCGDGTCEDPLLPGEPGLNWDGLTNITDVTIDAHLYPQSGSGLIDGAKTLTEEATSLTHGTAFNDLPGTETFVTAEQGENGTGWDFGALVGSPVVTVTANDAAADEDGGTGQYTISCVIDCVGQTINYSWSGGATLNDDFNATDEDGTIDITGASTTITLTPVDDGDVESGENATLTIDAGTGYVAGSPDNATIVIADNDDPSPPAGGADITMTGGSLTVDMTGGSLTITISPSP